jgi:hypothetical protein
MRPTPAPHPGGTPAPPARISFELWTLIANEKTADHRIWRTAAWRAKDDATRSLNARPMGFWEDRLTRTTCKATPHRSRRGQGTLAALHRFNPKDGTLSSDSLCAGQEGFTSVCVRHPGWRTVHPPNCQDFHGFAGYQAPSPTPTPKSLSSVWVMRHASTAMMSPAHWGWSAIVGCMLCG